MRQLAKDLGIGLRTDVSYPAPKFSPVEGYTLGRLDSVAVGGYFLYNVQDGTLKEFRRVHLAHGLGLALLSKHVSEPSRLRDGADEIDKKFFAMRVDTAEIAVFRVNVEVPIKNVEVKTDLSKERI